MSQYTSSQIDKQFEYESKNLGSNKATSYKEPDGPKETRVHDTIMMPDTSVYYREIITDKESGVVNEERAKWKKLEPLFWR